MSTPNLYWPVYKNLEKEFLKLADYIHFSDEQLGTYSMFIADLIVRCSVEIEALSKELYCMLGGNMSPTDLQGFRYRLFKFVGSKMDFEQKANSGFCHQLLFC